MRTLCRALQGLLVHESLNLGLRWAGSDQSSRSILPRGMALGKGEAAEASVSLSVPWGQWQCVLHWVGVRHR